MRVRLSSVMKGWDEVPQSTGNLNSAGFASDIQTQKNGKCRKNMPQTLKVQVSRSNLSHVQQEMGKEQGFKDETTLVPSIALQMKK